MGCAVHACVVDQIVGHARNELAHQEDAEAIGEVGHDDAGEAGIEADRADEEWRCEFHPPAHLLQPPDVPGMEAAGIIEAVARRGRWFWRRCSVSRLGAISLGLLRSSGIFKRKK
ncbi:hypothetical protein [Mesorhizobium sp. BR1-1-2]|uniref:hypothetical protein n=1 Tax=Mesorhizobium sp. BR1-1-2 TaxID=2876652 RepID=UPI001CC9F569|nr:hypothetical protein [Mesorhizobium sp. BR1-1-2]MBZ9964759.1 hypothetical protein [Mesorhizobium sp. BR1-1-2]